MKDSHRTLIGQTLFISMAVFALSSAAWGYCNADGGSWGYLNGEYIYRVIFRESSTGNVVFDSGLTLNSGYYLSNTSWTLEVGKTYDFDITPSIGSGPGAYVGDRLVIWVDWTDDGDFNDLGDLCYSKTLFQGNAPVFSGSITVPDNAAEGIARMRIRLYDTYYNSQDPCGSTAYGEVEDYNFTVKTNTGSVAGIKFDDIDGDGVRDAGEPGLAGWEIYIDENGNSLHDYGEPNDATDATGYYKITGVDAKSATCTVAETMKSGWSQSFPGGDETHVLTMDPNAIHMDINFGNTTQPLIVAVTLSGHVTMDDGTAIEGWQLDLDLDGNLSTAEMSTTTDAQGYYLFELDAPWTGTLQLNLPDGWYSHLPILHENITTDITEDFVCYYQYSGGSGIEGDPYIIATIDDWDEFEATSDDWSAHFILTTDIDLTGRTYTQSPIAGDADNDYVFEGIAFSGVFNGNGHVISNLSIDGTHYCGLFGKTSSAEIQNLGVEDVSISCTGTRIGGLVGSKGGSITNCYSTGEIDGFGSAGGLVGSNGGSINGSYSNADVTSSGNNIGGLVGYNGYGTITSSYSSGKVVGDDSVGGLIGFNDDGNITNSYSSSNVTGDDMVGGVVGENINGDINSSYAVGTINGKSNIGGLVGYSNNGSVADSYLYIHGGPDNGYGVALDEAQLQDAGSFVGFDFAGDPSNGTEDIWMVEPGYMPRLSWQEGPGFEVPLNGITTTLSGLGYANDPFIIASYSDLMEFKNNPALRIGHYSLTTDIDLSGITYTEAFIPECFSGSFDGNGHKISNLTINGDDDLGFFSVLGGSVDNLALEEVIIISSGYYIGGMAGTNYYGNITGSSSAGSVNGYYGVGGLVGVNINGEISKSFATGTVNGSYNHVGGLTGSNFYGRIEKSYSSCEVTGNGTIGGLTGSSNYYIFDCYSTGKVTGVGAVGGLVGDNDSSIMRSYSTCKVTGGSGAGGLVSNNDGHISYCYFYINGGPDNGHGIALDDAQLKDENSFVGFDFNVVWDICNGMNYPRLQCQPRSKADIVCPDGVEINDLLVLCDEWLSGHKISDIAPYDCDGFVDYYDWAVFADAWFTTDVDINYNAACDIWPVGGDNSIDIMDMNVFINDWLSPSACLADIAEDGCDGFVDHRDWAIFAKAWLTTDADTNYNVACDIWPAGGDNSIDINDLGVFINEWLSNNACSANFAPDANDGYVDLQDFAVFAQYWLEGI